MRRRATEQAFGLTRERPPVRRSLKGITRRFVTRADGRQRLPASREPRPHFATLKGERLPMPHRVARRANSGMGPGDRWERHIARLDELFTEIRLAVRPGRHRRPGITQVFVTAVVAVSATQRRWDAQNQEARDNLQAVRATPKKSINDNFQNTAADGNVGVGVSFR